MNKFEFNGDWKIKIDSKWFCNLRSELFFPRNSGLHWKQEVYNSLSNGKIIVEINDERNDNIEPEIQQINTINYIIENEELIYKNVFNAFKNKVVEDYKSYEYYPIEEQTFHLIQSIDQLPNHLGLIDVTITLCYESDYAFYILNFEFDGDWEHGLSMIFNRNQFLSYGETGSVSYKEYISDEKYEDLIRKINKSPENKFYSINNKFGKNKPWKNEANEYFIKKLIRDGLNEEIFNLIEQDFITKNERIGTGYATLMEYAASYGNIAVLEYLISRNWEFGRSISFCCYEQFKEETIQFLAENDADIDIISPSGKTSLYNEIYNFIDSNGKYSYNKKYEKDQLAEINLKDILKFKNNIIFLLKLGANPYSCDIEGNDYKAILGKVYDIKNLELSEFFIELEKTVEKYNTGFYKSDN